MKNRIILYFVLLLFFFFIPNFVLAAHEKNTDCNSKTTEDCLYCEYAYESGFGPTYYLGILYKKGNSPLKYYNYTEGKIQNARGLGSISVKSSNFSKELFSSLKCPNVKIEQVNTSSNVTQSNYEIVFSPNGSEKAVEEITYKGVNPSGNSDNTANVCHYNTKCGELDVFIENNKAEVRFSNTVSFSVENTLDASKFSNGACPKIYTVRYQDANINKCYISTSELGNTGLSGRGSSESSSSSGKKKNDNSPAYTNSDPSTEQQNCESLLGSPYAKGGPTEGASPAYYLTFAFKIVRYVAIIILIVISIMDMLSAVTSHDNDQIKKATSKIIKRLIICILIFLLPGLLEWILSVIHNNATSLCIDS